MSQKITSPAKEHSLKKLKTFCQMLLIGMYPYSRFMGYKYALQGHWHVVSLGPKRYLSP